MSSTYRCYEFEILSHSFVIYFNTVDQRFSNCGPRTTSGPRVLPLWSLYRLNINPKKDRKNKINVNYVSHTIVENLRVWKLHTTSVFKLSLPGLTFYETYYPTYSTLSNKRGIFCCKNMFRTLFKAGLMSLIIPRVGWSVEHSE